MLFAILGWETPVTRSGSCNNKSFAREAKAPTLVGMPAALKVGLRVIFIMGLVDMSQARKGMYEAPQPNLEMARKAVRMPSPLAVSVQGWLAGEMEGP